MVILTVKAKTLCKTHDLGQFIEAFLESKFLDKDFHDKQQRDKDYSSSKVKIEIQDTKFLFMNVRVHCHNIKHMFCYANACHLSKIINSKNSNQYT